MQISKLTLMALLIGAAACQLGAQPASPDQQNRAIQLLRQTIAQEQAQSAQTPPVTASTAVVAPAKTAKPSSASHVKAPTAKVDNAPAMPEQPAGPKTKQQRLQELLEIYKADKLTPAEYHAQRVKIVAEP